MPVPVSSAPAVNLGDLAAAIEAARNLAHEANVPIPPQLAKDGLGLVRLAIRQAKGLQPRRRLIEGSK
jgi:hypothetical protein